ncbi:hypothetical protein C0993_004021 [Termitomyces sp. T159_Od127]|nr:hypothetical protein C0993_004021 [Termitomyces sp. T159_Od127]
MRRSIFGYFSRRCFVSFIKLSFSGVVKLQRDYQSWRYGDVSAGYDPVVKDQMSNSDLLIFKTQADKKSWAKPDAYEAWEQGQITGDENVATENLRRFFEQHFHESNDSMLHRLPPTEPGRKPTLNALQQDLHPLEVLFDVKKLVDTKNDQPLSAAFVKIDQATGLYDHWLDAQGTPPIDEEQWAQHAVQSVVWDAIGCSKLASIEESIVLAFTQPGTEDHNRFTMIINGSDLEQRAFACFTLARSMIAASSSSIATRLQETLPYLIIAEGDYQKLGMCASLMHVQYLLSVVYHNLGMLQERDAAARRHFMTLELQRKQDAVVVEDDTQRILEVVELVGAHLAGRYSN